MTVYNFDEIEIKADPQTYDEAEKQKFDIIESEMDKLYTPSEMSNIIDGVSIHSKAGLEQAKEKAIIETLETMTPKKKIDSKILLAIGAGLALIYLVGRK